MKHPAHEHTCIYQIKRNHQHQIYVLKDSDGKPIIEDPPQQDENYPLDMPDTRVLAFELKRKPSDQLQTEASPITTCLLKCNTCMTFCGTRSQAKNTVFYMSGYFCKLPTELNQSLPVFYAARQETKKYPSQKDGAGTAKVDAQYTVTKTLNRMTALMEYTDTQTASTLLGYPSFCSSHKCWFLHARDAITFQKTHFKGNVYNGINIFTI